MLTLQNNTLITEDSPTPLFTDLPDTVSVVDDATGIGGFLYWKAEKAAARHRLTVGKLAGVARFTLCHRYEPFWMTARSGTTAREILPETQYLLAKREQDYLLLIPLIDGTFRCSLEGSDDETVYLVAESGDGATVTDDVTGLFVATGDDAFDLLKEGAYAVARHLKTGRLRTEKPVPALIEQFGWCTWDAFYGEVSHEKVREGLESFAAGGLQPKYLILDDGWQSVRQFPNGEKRLTGFAANSKFPGDLKPTVDMAKQEFGVETFLVWHAIGGYWGGVDGEALPGYGVRSQERQYSEGIHHHVPTLENWFGTACGVVPAEHIYRFYQDYHRHLRQQGVDGVKVDNQASLEGLAQGHGGRVALMRAYREALEGSVHVHFEGNLINCMSLANEMLFMSLNSNITRAFTDFWPNKPESHGLHLYANSQVSAFWGEFIQPDWDMFQSGHEMGAFHAAGRAVSGGPVYVSDKPGVHNFDVLRKLVLPDGSVLRCNEPGRPTLDCLFHDPTREDVLLKIWNTNPVGAIVGVFHARYGEGVGAIGGTVSPADIPGIEGEKFAVYAHYAEELRILARSDRWDLSLEPLTAEVFTVVPVVSDFAPLGARELFNSSAVVVHYEVERVTRYTLILLCGGKMLVYCAAAPTHVEWEGVGVPFTYDTATGRMEFELPMETVYPVVHITTEVNP
ncbi:MAG: hypothetical protein OHK0029_28590 [Armatimonadaceae bacterium]